MLWQLSILRLILEETISIPSCHHLASTTTLVVCDRSHLSSRNITLYHIIAIAFE